jgi:mRNA interferase MazF
MLKPKRGEIWLARFPFTDLTTTKLRPALILAMHRKDVIVMGIFSRVSDGILPNSPALFTCIDTHDMERAPNPQGLRKP